MGTAAETSQTRVDPMSFGRAFLVALCLSVACAGLVAFVSRTPSEVRAPRADVAGDATGFTDAQVARHGAFRGPLYLAFVVSLLVQVVFLVMVRGDGLSQLIELAGRFPGGWVSQTALVAEVVAAALTLIGLPLGYVRGHAIQKAWHLSNQDALAWLLDQVKGLGLSVAFAAIAAVAFFAVVRWQPGSWWVWGAASFTVLSAILVFLFPVLIAPLFNRFTPLADRDLSARIETLAERAGVEIDRVLVADASKRSSAENAYVAGLGATKQVVLYDTLLEGNEEPETLFVVAHELGHEAENHVLKGLGVSAVGLVVGFALLAWLVRQGSFLRWAGADSVTDLRILPALLLFTVAAGLLAQPIQNAVSRRFEARADAIAFDLTGDPDPAIKAFRSLAISNISDLRPPAVVEWMFYSHPPIVDRIEAARAAGARKP